jgi:hypothetical protein
VIAFPQPNHRKSKLGLRHAIKPEMSFKPLLHDEVRILIFDDPTEKKNHKVLSFLLQQVYNIEGTCVYTAVVTCTTVPGYTCIAFYSITAVPGYL